MNVVFVASASAPDGITEVVDGLGWVASSSHAIDGENARVVPSSNVVFEDELMEFSFGHDRVCDV